MQELRHIFLRSCLPNISFFFSISGFNSHGFSLILSGDTWKKYLSIQLFKKNEIYFFFNIPQIWVGVQRLSNCKNFLNELFCGGLHLHCLTLSLQTLIVMLTVLIRSCLTVFPMNRAPGFMRSVTRSVYCIVLAVHLFDLVFWQGIYLPFLYMYMFTATTCIIYMLMCM